jgi:hypothetical protein
MSLAQQHRELARKVRALEAFTPRIPLRHVMNRGDVLVVKIVGGQTVSGYPMIQYMSDATYVIDKFYDPEVDTAYLAGLGYGQLYDLNGQPGGLVLVRHNFQADTDPLIAGVPRVVTGSVTLIEPDDDDPDTQPRSMTAYTIGFPAI